MTSTNLSNISQASVSVCGIDHVRNYLAFPYVGKGNILHLETAYISGILFDDAAMLSTTYLTETAQSNQGFRFSSFGSEILAAATSVDISVLTNEGSLSSQWFEPSLPMLLTADSLGVHGKIELPGFEIPWKREQFPL